MRLIDADALVERLEKSHEYHARTSREEVLLFRDIRIINEQPTAYDVDAVVEQLDKASYEADCLGATVKYLNFDDTVHIVRAGGEEKL